MNYNRNDLLDVIGNAPKLLYTYRGDILSTIFDISNYVLEVDTVLFVCEGLSTPIELVEISQNKWQLTLSRAQTTMMVPQNYKFSINVRYIDLTEETLYNGTLEIYSKANTNNSNLHYQSTFLEERAPINTDNTYLIGSLWIDTIKNNAYILSSIDANNNANWVSLFIGEVFDNIEQLTIALNSFTDKFNLDLSQLDTKIDNVEININNNLNTFKTNTVNNIVSLNKRIDDETIRFEYYNLISEFPTIGIENVIYVVKPSLEEDDYLLYYYNKDINKYVEFGSSSKKNIPLFETLEEVNVKIGEYFLLKTNTNVVQFMQKTSDTQIVDIHYNVDANYVIENSNKLFMLETERNKLSNIESGSQVNKLEGIQIDGTDKQITNKIINITKQDIETTIKKGSPNGVAELDTEGFVPSSQLPSFVDDVLEFDTLINFPITGESGKIYVALDNHLAYRWGGTTYNEISPSIALGETFSTAYPGNKGKLNAENIALLDDKISNYETNTDDTLTGITTNISNILNIELPKKVDKTIILPLNTDLNNIVESGFYTIMSSPINAPEFANYSQMIVSRGNDTIIQIVFIYSTKKMFYRTGNITTFINDDWHEVSKDLADWTKTPLKPTYTASEVGAITPIEVDTKISDIKIGGRNLILNTSASRTKSSSGWVANDWFLSDVMKSGTFMLSFKYDCDVSNDVGFSLGTDGIWDNTYELLVNLPAGNNMYFSSPITFVRDTQNSFAFYTNNVITIYDLKLEIGNKSTDWSPAPEDKQNTLISGINIKTLAMTSLLGNGNLTLESLGIADRVHLHDNYLQLSGGTLTGNLKTTTLSNTYNVQNVYRFFISDTPVETVIYTGIKYLSATHMPVVRIYGYAYGMQSPIELKIGFYIFDGILGWSGAISMGSWRPEIYLYKYNSGGIDYVAIGLNGSVYYLGFQVDVQLANNGSFGNTVMIDNWSSSYKIKAQVDIGDTLIPAIGTSNCIRVFYKSTITIDDIPSLPISQITNLQSNLNLKAPLASPVFTGIPKINADDIATTIYVDNKVAGIVNSAPETLDTLNELSIALGNDPNFATTMSTELGKKATTVYVNDELAKKANLVHSHNSLLAIDNRLIKPIDFVDMKRQLLLYFTSMGGLLTPSGNTDYQDLLILNTYSDATGGKINALSFDKSESKITHIQANIGAEEWDANPKVLAYTSDITNPKQLKINYRGQSYIYDGSVESEYTFDFDHGHTEEDTRLSLVTITDLNASSNTYPNGKTILMNNTTASVKTFTIDEGGTHIVGTELTIIRTGTGEVEIVAGTNVTINSFDNMKFINGQYQAVTLIKTAPNNWLLIGALKP